MSGNTYQKLAMFCIAVMSKMLGDMQASKSTVT